MMVVSAVALLGGLLGVAPADAGLGRSVVVSPSPVAPGEDFDVDGAADCIDDIVTVEVPELGLIDQVEGGVPWSVTFTVPPGTASGQYDVVVSGECDFLDGTLIVEAVESISLVETVGTDAGACATTSSISVEAGTTVYYCFTVTNNTESTLVAHSLTDDVLGDLFTDVAQDLAPGASASTVDLGLSFPAEPTSTTTDSATWTAVSARGVRFTATSGAIVNVLAVGVAPADGAAPVAAAPDFTG